MDGAAAGQPDRERFVVAVAERAQPAVAGTEDVERLGHDGPLDASTRDGTDDRALLVDRHRRAWLTRPRSLDVDDPRDRDAAIGGKPSVEFVEQFPHRFLPTSCASSSRAATECPSTNSS